MFAGSDAPTAAAATAPAASSAPTAARTAPPAAVEASKPATEPMALDKPAPAPATATVTSQPAPGPKVSSPPTSQTTAALTPTPAAKTQAPPSPIKPAHPTTEKPAQPIMLEGTNLGDPGVAYDDKRTAEESVPPQELEKVVAEVQAGTRWVADHPNSLLWSKLSPSTWKCPYIVSPAWSLKAAAGAENGATTASPGKAAAASTSSPDKATAAEAMSPSSPSKSPGNKRKKPATPAEGVRRSKRLTGN